MFGGLYVSAADKNIDARAAMAVSVLGIAGGLATAWALTTGMPQDRLTDEKPKDTGFTPGGITVGQIPGGATLTAYGAF